jgi:hypothetical protein
MRPNWLVQHNSHASGPTPSLLITRNGDRAASDTMAQAPLLAYVAWMAERLGQTLYWVVCVIAGLFVILGAYFSVTDPDGYAWGSLLVCLTFAGATWLLGRSILFALAAR